MHTFTPIPEREPPVAISGIVGWARAHLFSSPLNIALTVLSLYILSITVVPVIQWAFVNAIWSGGPSACAPGRDGAIEDLWPGARVTRLTNAPGAAFAGAGRASLQGAFLWLALMLLLGETVLASGHRRSA